MEFSSIIFEHPKDQENKQHSFFVSEEIEAFTPSNSYIASSISTFPVLDSMKDQEELLKKGKNILNKRMKPLENTFANKDFLTEKFQNNNFTKILKNISNP